MDKLYAVIIVLLAMVLLSERIVGFLGWLLVPFGRRRASLGAAS